MPDELPEHLAGWTPQTEHVYTRRVVAELEKQFILRIEALERLFEQRIADMAVLHHSQLQAAEKAVEAALKSSEKAIDKSAVEIERWREANNEWRAAMYDREKNFATKSEFDAVKDTLQTHSSRMDKTEGRGVGASSLWGIAVSAFAVLGVVVSVLLAFSRQVGH